MVQPIEAETLMPAVLFTKRRVTRTTAILKTLLSSITANIDTLLSGIPANCNKAGVQSSPPTLFWGLQAAD